jgi:3-deoxy-D-manno-octulosonic-acid transferase
VLYFFYNLVFTVVFVTGLLFLPLVFMLGTRYREGLRQRLGVYPDTLFKPVAGGRAVWIHAASVGEVRSAMHFIHELKRILPTRKIVLSTFTATGHRIAKELASADVIMFLPLDVLWIARRALAKIEPSVLVVIETEIWPNLLREAYKKGIPTLLLSGRLSVRGFHKYSLFGRFFSQVVKCFTAVGMQSKEDADRIVKLGAEAAKVAVTGSLKHFSGTAKPFLERRRRRDSPLLIVGSSHRGEEEILLKVFISLKQQFTNLQMVLAPRHPQRFAEVEKLLRSTGLQFDKRTEMDGRVDFDKDIMFLDTVGDLYDFYAVGDVAFVGGSLVDAGGHNLLEPARFGKPVLFGPYMTNFSSLAAEMKQKGGGIEVHGAEDLIREITSLLSDAQKRKARGAKASAVAVNDYGVMDRSVGLVARYL